ncbi:MAG TPA: aryl-sulfate sulfotransferase [Candidatus Angelobacter sp.]|nr:aryl-sulfate sulfotransferase [Candidatus Angelobacter sp.]
MKVTALRLNVSICIILYGIAVRSQSVHANFPSLAPVISPRSAAVLSGGSIQFAASVAGKPVEELTWYVNGIAGGSPAVGTISSSGLYTAPAVSTPGTFLISGVLNPEGTLSKSAVVTLLAEGQVTPTSHPLVAKYAFLAPPGSTVQVQFGPDTDYGRETWEQRAPEDGGEVDILVAGMRASTLYHMRARVRLAHGGLLLDEDHTFVTGSIPVDRMPAIAATTTPGEAPQAGVELIDASLPPVPNGINAIVTDLDGNVIWYYEGVFPFVNHVFDPIKPLSNGRFLLNASRLDLENSVLQEVDLAGNVIWRMTASDLNRALAEAVCVGCNITVVGTHHDFAVLPNGHLVVLAAINRFMTNVADYPNGINVLGDVVIDLDRSRKPVWLWSAFDHLDVNRHPIGFPDWTHSNTIVYSPADHSLIVSMRHQSWVIKIDYNDGKGRGDILWKLGYQGDFTLINGTSPVDWQYAQHDVNIVNPASEERRESRGNGEQPARQGRENEADVFDLLIFDNGNSRVLDANGDICGNGTSCYSRVVMFRLNEEARTAALKWVDSLPLFSFFGGSSRLLANGNIEFDECGLPGPEVRSAIYEVTQTSSLLVVWQMQVTGWFAYRAFRIPSLYPGVQW